MGIAALFYLGMGPYRAATEVPAELRGEIDAILVGLNVPRGAEVGGEAPLPGGREHLWSRLRVARMRS
jgi:hypothetical protein